MQRVIGLIFANVLNRFEIQHAQEQWGQLNLEFHLLFCLYCLISFPAERFYEAQSLLISWF